MEVHPFPSEHQNENPGILLFCPAEVSQELGKQPVPRAVTPSLSSLDPSWQLLCLIASPVSDTLITPCLQVTLQRFPGTKVSPLQPVLCRRACCWLQSSLGVQLSCPEGTHPSGDLGSWIQRSREPSVIRGNLSIVFTQLSRNGSRVCQSCRQQRLRLRAGDPHWGSALSEQAGGKLSRRESNLNYRCKLKLFSLVLLMKK